MRGVRFHYEDEWEVRGVVPGHKSCNVEITAHAEENKKPGK